MKQKNRIHKVNFKWMKGRGYSFFSIFLLLVILFALSGCSGTFREKPDQNEEKSAVVEFSRISGPQSKKKIYVILKNYHGEYWNKVIEGVSSAVKEMEAEVYLGGIDNETDIEGQISLIEEAVEEGSDGILLAPANSNSLVESCKKIRENQIPLVLIDSSINSDDFDMCYMTDNMEAGKMAAKEMLELLYAAGNAPPDSLKVGILLSSDTSQAMVNRVSGFLDYWAEYAPEEWEIAKDIRINGGDVTKAESDALTLLKEDNSMKGIFGCNNTSTVGIAKTLIKEKRTDVVMAGFDLAEETKEIIQNSDYHGITLLQKQEEMGYQGLISLSHLIDGQESEQKYFDTGVILINPEYLMENELE